MLKQRLSHKDTKFVIVVGYSFRDDYMLRIFWDAARKNEGLHVILVSPSAGTIFSRQLKDTGPNNPSRIYNRVVCLPYPFATVISKLRNYYLQKLRRVIEIEKELAETVRQGREPDILSLVKESIECEFESKTEEILSRNFKNWESLGFEFSHQSFIYALKGLLHSVIAREPSTYEDWLNRVNRNLGIFDKENLRISNVDIEEGFRITFNSVYQNSNVEFDASHIVEKWLNPAFEEESNKIQLLGANPYDSMRPVSSSFEKLRGFKFYLDNFRFSRILWQDYFKLRKNYVQMEKIKENLQIWPILEIEKNLLTVEKKELSKIFGGSTLKFNVT